jgi:hypothetical protein
VEVAAGKKLCSRRLVDVYWFHDFEWTVPFVVEFLRGGLGLDTFTIKKYKGPWYEGRYVTMVLVERSLHG